MVAPISGKFLRSGREGKHQWPFMDIQLDHGIIVRAVHVEAPTAAEKKWMETLKPGDTVHAGQWIGTPQRFAGDPSLDDVALHQHVQIMVPDPSRPGKYFVVDPALFVPSMDYMPWSRGNLIESPPPEPVAPAKSRATSKGRWYKGNLLPP